MNVSYVFYLLEMLEQELLSTKCPILKTQLELEIKILEGKLNIHNSKLKENKLK